MKYKIIQSSERWVSENHGIKSRFSFSFADYYDPDRLWFGVLRVINDDVIAPKSGFGMHQHRDMEIITIVLSGELTHEDSMGNLKTIQAGEVQIMSAGTGIFHSEVNLSDTEPVCLFQIWIFPHSFGISPRYGQVKYSIPSNKLGVAVTGISNNIDPLTTQSEKSLQIMQNAMISIGKFDEGKSFSCEIPAGSGAYVMVIDGEFLLSDCVLQARDAMEIAETLHFSGTCISSGRLLVIRVPMYKY